MQILVVDDELENLDLMVDILQARGHQVAGANDGIEALQEVRSKNYDIILLDIMMPKKDGFEVLCEMKQDPQLQQIPVVLVSGLAFDSDIKKGKDLGCLEYLPKPVDFDALYKILEDVGNK